MALALYRTFRFHRQSSLGESYGLALVVRQKLHRQCDFPLCISFRVRVENVLQDAVHRCDLRKERRNDRPPYRPKGCSFPRFFRLLLSASYVTSLLGDPKDRGRFLLFSVEAGLSGNLRGHFHYGEISETPLAGIQGGLHGHGGLKNALCRNADADGLALVVRQKWSGARRQAETPPSV